MKSNTNTPKQQKYKRGGVYIRLENISKITLRQKFDTLLAEKGISQNQFADQLGISKSLISQIINQNWYPSSKLMVKIAKALNVDSVILFGNKEYWEKWRDKTLYD